MEKFLELLAQFVFEDTDGNEITENSIFSHFEEWDSLTALTLIATIDDEYNVEITGDEINNANTLGDIFDIVQKKKK